MELAATGIGSFRVVSSESAELMVELPPQPLAMSSAASATAVSRVIPRVARGRLGRVRLRQKKNSAGRRCEQAEEDRTDTAGLRPCS